MTDQEDAILACKAAALRYCRGVDRLDPEVMRSAYWPDATDEHGTFSGNAYDFVDRCMTSHLRWRSTMHCVLNHVVEVDSETSARGEVYNITYLFRNAEGDRDTGETGESTEPGDIVDTWWGRYLDRYERRGDEWRIAHRICVSEATMTTPITEHMPIPTELFRSGDVDRGAPRPLGT